MDTYFFFLFFLIYVLFSTGSDPNESLGKVKICIKLDKYKMTNKKVRWEAELVWYKMQLAQN